MRLFRLQMSPIPNPIPNPNEIIPGFLETVATSIWVAGSRGAVSTRSEKAVTTDVGDTQLHFPYSAGRVRNPSPFFGNTRASSPSCAALVRARRGPDVV